jgi:hypothetical protein
MTTTDHPRVLLVEGDQDIWVILRLIEKNGITWKKNEDPFIHIYYPDFPDKEKGGKDKLLKHKFIKTYLEGSKLTALGLITDADKGVDRTWQRIKDVCRRSIPDIPDQLPEAGLVHDVQTSNTNLVKFGVWIMPDNKMVGMMETFLAYLVPDESATLWQYAQEVSTEAKKRGAPFTEAHIDKANIHAWLAWQDPPGLELHQAVMKQIFDTHHPKAQAFMNWFKALYDLV